MPGTSIAELIEELTAKAREASVAEQEFDREIARRRAEVVQARAFAWRRVSLLRAIAAELGRHEEEEEALAAGRRTFYRELGWNGATENQREVADQFEAVLQAAWRAEHDAERAPAPIAEAYEAFERWYLQSRQTSFLSLMQREIVELPLVEV